MPDDSTVAPLPDVSDDLPPLSKVDVPAEEISQYIHLHLTTFEYLWWTHFHILEDGPFLPRPSDVSVQVVRDARYSHECKYSQWQNYRYFCYTLSGSGMMRDASGTFAVPSGHCFLIEKDNAEAAYFYPPDAREPWVFLALNFNGLPAQAMVRGLIQKYGPVYALPPEPPVIKRLLGYKAIGHEVMNLHVADAAYLVTELLLALLAAGRMNEDADPLNEVVNRAIPIMSASGDVSIQEVADRIGVSREHLSRCFQKRLGTSPRQYCLELRIRKACILLKDTASPVKAIATKLGYADYSNFVHAFRQVMHLTPTEFRQRGSLLLANSLADGRGE